MKTKMLKTVVTEYEMIVFDGNNIGEIVSEIDNYLFNVRQGKFYCAENEYGNKNYTDSFEYGEHDDNEYSDLIFLRINIEDCFVKKDEWKFMTKRDFELYMLPSKPKEPSKFFDKY